MSEDIKYLEFRDADGNLISVAKKTSVEDEKGRVKIFLHAPAEFVVTTVDEETYNNGIQEVLDQNLTT